MATVIASPDHKPYPDWPKCRLGALSNFTVADALRLSDQYVLLCDAAYGGYVVALLTISGMRRMMQALPNTDPSSIKLKYWTPVLWATALRRIDADRKYAAQDNAINPYTNCTYASEGKDNHEFAKNNVE